MRSRLAMLPDSFVVHCPNGHASQASRENLGRMLACPICNAVFMAEPPPAPPSDLASSRPMAPDLGAPLVRPPTFTRILICIWVFVDTTMLMSFLLPADEASSSVPSLPPTLGAFPSLFTSVLIIVGFVLQLLWLHRLHTDANRIYHYSEIPPSLATVLACIPGFNYAWVGWTLHRLSRWVWQRRHERGEPVHSLDPLTFPCILFGALQGILLGIKILLLVLAGSKVFQGMDPTTMPLFPSPEEQIRRARDLADALPADVLLLITAAALTLTVYFAITVFKVEALVYGRTAPRDDATAVPPDIR